MVVGVKAADSKRLDLAQVVLDALVADRHVVHSVLLAQVTHHGVRCAQHRLDVAPEPQRSARIQRLPRGGTTIQNTFRFDGSLDLLEIR